MRSGPKLDIFENHIQHLVGNSNKNECLVRKPRAPNASISESIFVLPATIDTIFNFSLLFFYVLNHTRSPVVIVFLCFWNRFGIIKRMSVNCRTGASKSKENSV